MLLHVVHQVQPPADQADDSFARGLDTSEKFISKLTSELVL